ncbi:MAG: 4-hydroxy-tetrahydrodipicolinate reductase, partial [Planctomycetes bacterium]|nr:4-hydroxy-tetrahydrodipicolinate reductase [Planctomycetota bacterium]
TGLTTAQEGELQAAAEQIPVLLAANFSLGIAVMAKLAGQAAAALKGYDIEVTEMHHRRKADAPSGTAKRLLDAVLRPLERDYANDVKHGREGITGERSQREIGMHTIRGGDVVGDHTIIFAGEGERVEITHRATSRETFARGAVTAAKWLAGQSPGRYTIEDVLGI